MSLSTRELVVLVSTASAVLLALGALHAQSGELAQDWLQARSLAAFLLLFVTPGHFLLWGLGRRVDDPGELPEWCLRSLGLGLVFLTAAYGLTTLSVSFSRVVIGQLVLTGVLILFGARRRLRERSTHSLGVRTLLVLILFTAAMGLLLSRIGGFQGVIPSPREEPDLVAARKIAALPRVTPMALAYAPDRTSFPFALPTYAFALASLSLLSGLDPLQVFELARPLWGIAALLALYALARRVFGSDGVAVTTVATVTILAFAVPGLARFFPFSARAEVALAVLLPAGLVVAAAFLARDPPPRCDWLVAPLILCGARLATASTAPAMFLFIAGAAMVGAARSRKTAVFGRALWLAAWLFAAGALPSGEPEDASAVRTAMASGGFPALVGREALFPAADLLCLPLALVLGAALYRAGRFAGSLESALEAKLEPRRRIEIWLGGLDRPRSDGAILLPGPRAIAWTATISILLGLFALAASIWNAAGVDLGGGGSKSLIQQLRASEGKVAISDLSSWIAATRYLDLPEPMLDFIRAQPPGRVYAYAPDRIARLAVVTPHYVFSSGDLRPEEAIFLESFARLHDVELPPAGSSDRGAALASLYPPALERFPLANDLDETPLTELWLRELGVDFALWKSREPGAETPQRLRHRFSPVFESFRFTLYEVRRAD